MVTTERLWSASIDQSSSCTPSTRIAATIASTRRASLPSEKLGTHSTTGPLINTPPRFIIPRVRKRVPHPRHVFVFVARVGSYEAHITETVKML
jgi:hypothetical protein